MEEDLYPQIMMAKYNKIKILGQGTYGAVLLYEDEG